MGANHGKNSNSKNIVSHYIYIYGIDESMPDISRELVSFISPNIDLIKSIGVELSIFYLSETDIKDPEINQLLEKNNITKLPALKIKQKNKKILFTGNNKIIDYYAQLLGSDFLQNKKNYESMKQQQFLTKRNNLISQQNKMPQYQNPEIFQNAPFQYQNAPFQYQNAIQSKKSLPPKSNDDDDDDVSINDTKGIMDNFNKSIKERELRSKHSKKHSHGQEQSNTQEQVPKKHNLPPNILKEDIPFREGELDELLSDNLNTEFSI